MRLEFKISKTANFFFFVDNLSEWNMYYRKKYNEEWLQKFGKLTDTEKIALKNYAKIMQRYEKRGIAKKIRRCFYKKNDNISESFRRVSKLIKNNELTILKNSYKIIEPRFEKMWNENLNVIEYNKKLLSSAYKKVAKELNFAYKKLENFYGDKTKNDYLCNVFLIISPNRGGKALRRDAISIETEKLDQNNSYRFARVWFSIMHELTHARFENKKYKNWLKNFIENETLSNRTKITNRNAKEVLREVITDLTKVALYHILDKDGILKIEGNIIVNKKGKTDDLNSLERVLRKELRQNIECYFSTKRKIDTDFLKKCWELIIKYS